MPTFLVFFIVAVVVWAVVSLVLLFTWQDKKESTDPMQKSRSFTSPFARKGQPGDKASEAGPERQTGGPSGHGADWQQQLSQIPGVLGWLLIDTDGEVLLASDIGIVEAAANDQTIRKIVTMISRLNPEVGNNSLRLMEWEGPQGQVLVAFPEEVHTPERLVLFLGTEAYKNQMRDLLSQMRWESRVKQEAVSSTS